MDQNLFPYLEAQIEVVTLADVLVAIDPCTIGLGRGASVVWTGLDSTTTTSFN